MIDPFNELDFFCYCPDPDLATCKLTENKVKSDGLNLTYVGTSECCKANITVHYIIPIRPETGQRKD